MAGWSLTTRVFAGSWVVLFLILLFKLWASLSGNYAVDWLGEFRFWGVIVLTSVGFLATRATRAALNDGRAGTGSTEDRDRPDD